MHKLKLHQVTKYDVLHFETQKMSKNTGGEGKLLQMGHITCEHDSSF